MLLRFMRNRTSTILVMYSLYLYFLGLSLRNTSKALVNLEMRRVVMFLDGIGFKGLQNIRFIKGKEYQPSY